MADITITWRGGERTFGDDRPLRVGRSAECDVLVLDERVSRNPHLELRFENGVWVLEDKSTGGTWSNGQRVQLVSVPQDHTFNLGAADGPELMLSPTVVASDPTAAAAPAPAAPAGAGLPPVDDPGEALLAEAAKLASEPSTDTPPPDQPASNQPPANLTPPNQPPVNQPPPHQAGPGQPSAGGVPRFDPSNTVALDDRALRLSYADKKLTVPPGYVITIGRDPACDLTIDNQIVSRQHARFSHDGTNWILEDLGSTRGTFVDGRRIRGGYRAEGVFEASLGDDTAGEKVRIVTSGEHTEPKSRLPLVLALGAFVVALLGVAIAVALSSDDEDDPVAAPAATQPQQPSASANTSDQLSTVKASTVLIEAVDDDGFSLWTGSGTIITVEGHILTNAHVADPPAESLDALVPLLGGLEDRTPPDGFVIWVSPEEDAAAEPRYIAELVASSDVQDASIIQITEDFETGDDVDIVDLAPIPIGSSSSLRAGQAIHSLGFPANATTNSISVLLGDVVSFVSAEEFEDIVGGDDRKVMNTSAVLGQGSSGGPIVRDGKIVGLNATLSTGDGLDRGWAVPIDEIDELLEEVGLAPGE